MSGGVARLAGVWCSCGGSISSPLAWRPSSHPISPSCPPPLDMDRMFAGAVVPPAPCLTLISQPSTNLQLGMDGVFVGSGIFKSGDPAKRARAIVQVRACAYALLHRTPNALCILSLW